MGWAVAVVLCVFVLDEELLLVLVDAEACAATAAVTGDVVAEVVCVVVVSCTGAAGAVGAVVVDVVVTA